MPDPSVAAASFARALDLIRHRVADPLDRPVPLTYIGAGARPVAPGGGIDAPPSGSGPLADALQGQRAGTVSSVELVEASLAAVERHDHRLHAVVELDVAGALVEAAAADRDRTAGRWRGPLHGIPMTVKDVIDVAGFTTRGGSAAYARQATSEGAAVARLRAAGAVIVGKVSTHEFALGVTNPQSRNPYDDTRIPGGSSGGSAVSVATGMALASLGTDTRASIRVPAALSGVVGLKATIGAVPTAGILSLSWTMDHVAPIASTVADAAHVLGVLVGHPLPFWASAQGLRVGLADATFDAVDPGIVAAVEEVLARLVRAGGARLVQVAEPSAASLDLASAAGLIVSRCEAATLHRALGLDRSLYWDEVADQLDAADAVTAVDYLEAQRLRGQLAERLLGCFDTVDVLAMPTTATTAPTVEDAGNHLMSLARNAIPWSFVGFPAISLPVGFVDGLPVGLQLVAPPHHEGLLLTAALAIESPLPSVPTSGPLRGPKWALSRSGEA